MLKASKLQVGDTVGIVSPSWGGAGAYPHRFERGVEHIQSLGFKVKIGDHARHQRGVVSDTAENRAADIHAMFAASEVKAIFSAIGGDHSCHLLTLLDFDLIRANPKIFVGYSDTHIIAATIWKETKLVTFAGPAVLTDFAEYPSMVDYSQQYVLKALTENQPVGVIEPSPWWTEEFIDWGDKEDGVRPRARQSSPGWTWLKHGVAEGILIGGCLESLQHLRGTRFWPEWDDAIFFFETSEEKPSPEKVDGILMDYENMGVLAKINGLLVGRAKSYTGAEKQRLRDVVLERTRRYSFPVITDMDFGHTAPLFTLPIGCRARIDTGNRRFEILEAAVK